MNIDETNKWAQWLLLAAVFRSELQASMRRLRISLGLKPLNMEKPQQQSQGDMKKQEEAKQKVEQEKQAAEMRARIAS